ncbi:uncharacterized protein [Narcine bancroftii]
MYPLLQESMDKPDWEKSRNKWSYGDWCSTRKASQKRLQKITLQGKEPESFINKSLQGNLMQPEKIKELFKEDLRDKISTQKDGCDTVVTTLSDPLKSSSSSLFGGEQFKMAWEPLEHCMMIMQKTCKNCEGMHYLRSNLHCKPPLCKKKCSFHFGIISHFKPK